MRMLENSIFQVVRNEQSAIHYDGGTDETANLTAISMIA